MKGVKLKSLLHPDNNQILIKPPEFLLESTETDPIGWKNFTFSNISELNSYRRQIHSKRHSIKSTIQDDHEQVEKLSHWRLSSAGNPMPHVSKRYTFKNRTSVTIDPEKLRQLHLLSPTNKTHPTISANERTKAKLLKDEVSKVSLKNRLVIENTQKGIQQISIEIEKLTQNGRVVKEEIESLLKQQSSQEGEYHAKLAALQQQEAAILLITRNIHGQKLFKAGEMHEAFFIREKIRQEKSDLHVAFQQDKEKVLALIQEKKKEQETVVFSKNEWKKEQTVLRATLCNMYLKILKQGIDIREEGLRWVIKALWELKESIPLSAFPKYLDEESSQYLLTMATLELELAEYQRRLEATREKMKEERIAFGYKKNTVDLLMNVKDRIKLLSRSVVASSVRGGEVLIKEESGGQSDGKNFTNELTWIKENIDRIQKVMAGISDREVQRVAENYKMSSKEIGIGHILKALIGQNPRDFSKFPSYIN